MLSYGTIDKPIPIIGELARADRNPITRVQQAHLSYGVLLQLTIHRKFLDSVPNQQAIKALLCLTGTSV